MKKVTVSASREYDVIIKKGILDRAGEEAAKVISPCRAAILTDSNVAKLYLAKLEKSLALSGFSPVSFTFDAGEESKNPETLLSFLNFLAEQNITRSDCIFALGGGVVGDLGGFAAAIYLRGIEFIQIPTTLLAMVDSSVGGKTAIDIPSGKNLVGAFYQPSLVLCDSNTLLTLPENVFRDGLAEVVKYGIINDRELFEKLDSPIMPVIDDIIENCIKNKRALVSADERDTGVRRLLNFGHTVAHSIEKLSDFKISHGQAVSMGIATVTRAAAAEGICPESDRDMIIAMLKSLSLPTSSPYSAKEIAEAALFDKKRSGGRLSLIIPRGIGKAEVCEKDVDALEDFFKKGI